VLGNLAMACHSETRRSAQRDILEPRDFMLTETTRDKGTLSTI
jgi:hypothetical protein